MLLYITHVKLRANLIRYDSILNWIARLTLIFLNDLFLSTAENYRSLKQKEGCIFFPQKWTLGWYEPIMWRHHPCFTWGLSAQVLSMCLCLAENGLPSIESIEILITLCSVFVHCKVGDRFLNINLKILSVFFFKATMSLKPEKSWLTVGSTSSLHQT